ncbi:MAG TPA: NADH-quinone oxidoreductase subunit A [bacterium]|jgi:NADH-quinone oxidoreductase subunit A
MTPPISENNLVAFLVLLVMAGGLVGMFVALSKWFGPKRPNATKDRPFECGILVEAEAQRPYPIKYYLVAILFIVFDIETAFLYPWAVRFKSLGGVGFVSMMIFLSILLVGLYYAVKKRVFDWK